MLIDLIFFLINVFAFLIALSLLLIFVVAYLAYDVTISFKWYDLWIGYYVDHENACVYFILFPTIVFRFDLCPYPFYIMKRQAIEMEPDTFRKFVTYKVVEIKQDGNHESWPQEFKTWLGAYWSMRKLYKGWQRTNK